MTDNAERREHDLLGDIHVPADAYWGAHTTRARANFPITGRPIAEFPHLIEAIAWVKAAAADANRQLGLIDQDIAAAIIEACTEIVAGHLHDQFIVDIMQGGAGTSTNMNANEVIANRALELLHHGKGSYEVVSLNDHVNLSQSTNDVYPTALRVGLYRSCEALLGAMLGLQDAFTAKAEEFRNTLKVGRTQLQDAVPITLGQELQAYAVTIGEDRDRLEEARRLLCEINLGGTAIGTGINTHPDYQHLACRLLAGFSGVPVTPADDLVEATQDAGVLVQLSSVFKRIAVKTSKICNDLRLLSSGPQNGFNDISLPAVQAGSSIMPGKVNPVIPEVVNQIAFATIGRDITITMAAEAGQLQLNAFEPVIARCLFESVTELAAGCDVLAERCVRGISANRDRLRAAVESSIGLATALAPRIGYRAATELALTALSTGETIRHALTAREALPGTELDQLIDDPITLTGRRELK